MSRNAEEAYATGVQSTDVSRSLYYRLSFNTHNEVNAKIRNHLTTSGKSLRNVGHPYAAEVVGPHWQNKRRLKSVLLTPATSAPFSRIRYFEFAVGFGGWAPRGTIHSSTVGCGQVPPITVTRRLDSMPRLFFRKSRILVVIF